MSSHVWRVGVDIGGTFTDFVVLDETSGDLHNFKLNSTPWAPEEAVLEGMNHVSIDVAGSTSIVHGSTVATNALLQRKGARTAFVTTNGFRDLLTIGRQNREQIYDLFSGRPAPLVPPVDCYEIKERVDCHGNVLQSLMENELLALKSDLLKQKFEAVAVSFLFSFLCPKHEKRVASMLREAGFSVSLSSEIVPEFREYERASTTVINAYVTPVLSGYLGRLESEFSSTGFEFRIMQSNGGSISVNRARAQAVRSILSGPAGGVIGAAYVAREVGIRQFMTFDMGGTSTDVSLYQGDISLTSEAEVGGLPIRIPVVDIHTIGAGGGSIAQVDVGGALKVGPSSAGSYPGPACYGRGGNQPTVTDANLVLGRIASEKFIGGHMELDRNAAFSSLERLANHIGRVSALGLTPVELAAIGVIDVANSRMQRALRLVSLESGFDPRDFTLFVYGGAGGLHACSVARALGMRSALVPRCASTLSALGMISANVTKDYVQTVMLPGSTPYPDIYGQFEPLEVRAWQDMETENIPAQHIIVERELDVRYQGQSYELSVALNTGYQSEFHRAHNKQYGHSDVDSPLEIVNVRLRAVGVVRPVPLPHADLGSTDATGALIDVRRVLIATGFVETPFFSGEDLRPGHTISGPAVISYDDNTVLLMYGDVARVDPWFNLVIEIFPLGSNESI